MPQITVPKDFFVNERRMYSNWLEAFWREFFQNSIDAGATRIDVMTEDLLDKNVRITFTDNGCGMSRETLENVYFRLGASSKNDGSSIGGFGRARILTCFSMKNYEIRTRNNLVIGDGGSYDITDCDYFDGTQVIVNMEDEWFYTVIQALHSYLRMSQMRCKVYLNNVPWSDWTCRRKLTRHLERDEVAFADVYVNKSGSKNTMLVRVAGALMYAQWINAPAEVIVEILPSVSRQVLTANRDGMQSPYQSVLNRFTQELASETMTALEPKFKRKTATIRGTGLFVSRRKQANDAVESVEQAEVAALIKKAAASVNVDTIRVSDNFGGRPASVALDFKVDIKPSDYHGGSFLSELPDIFIIDDTVNEKVRRVIDNYHPANWVTLYRGNKVVNKGSTIYKVLMSWKICCQYAIDALLVAYPSLQNVTWGIGWTFDDQAAATCKAVDNGHALLLNPVDTDGNLKYFLRSQESQKRMMAYAKHEVAHIVEKYHNEMFARVLTSIDEYFDERVVYKAIRENVY